MFTLCLSLRRGGGGLFIIIIHFILAYLWPTNTSYRRWCAPFHLLPSLSHTRPQVINWRKHLNVPTELRFEELDIRIKPEVKNIIERLCCGADERLGKFGAEEIKSHLFFKSIDFEKGLRNQEAPYKPTIRYPTDTSNFDVDDSQGSSDDDCDGLTKFTEDAFMDRFKSKAGHGFFEFTFRRFFDASGQGGTCPALKGAGNALANNNYNNNNNNNNQSPSPNEEDVESVSNDVKLNAPPPPPNIYNGHQATTEEFSGSAKATPVVTSEDGGNNNNPPNGTIRVQLINKGGGGATVMSTATTKTTENGIDKLKIKVNGDNTTTSILVGATSTTANTPKTIAEINGTIPVNFKLSYLIIWF